MEPNPPINQMEPATSTPYVVLDPPSVAPVAPYYSPSPSVYPYPSLRPPDDPNNPIVETKWYRIGSGAFFIAFVLIGTFLKLKRKQRLRQQNTGRQTVPVDPKDETTNEQGVELQAKAQPETTAIPLGGSDYAAANDNKYTSTATATVTVDPYASSNYSSASANYPTAYAVETSADTGYPTSYAATFASSNKK